MPRLPALAALVLCLAACTDAGRFAGECANNGQCPVGSICRISPTTGAGLCVCRSDEACPLGEICNSQGVCQKQAGCRTNVECEAAKFCDPGTGACIDRTGCGSDVHCLPGTVCEGGRCLDGCHSTADCPLYSICEGGTATALGRCTAGKCDDKSFCAFGSTCTGQTCTVDPDPNLCKLNCNEVVTCGPGDFCLINSAYDPNNPRSNYETFCGVDCTGESDCPNGYQCGGVVLLTDDQCTNDGECGGGGRRCALGEGDLRGFCTCVSNQDCAFDQVQLCLGGFCLTDASSCSADEDCLCDGGTCFNTGRPCNVGADCNPPCINGGCFLGNACAPNEGLLCTDVR